MKKNVNNTKIRIEKRKEGTFTVVSHKILFDSTIKPNSKILLLAILSDSDSFDLSQTVYCNRLNWDKKQFSRAIEDLESAGYVKRIAIEKEDMIPKIKKGGSNKIIYNYIISEHGNLNNPKDIKKAS